MSAAIGGTLLCFSQPTPGGAQDFAASVDETIDELARSASLAAARAGQPERGGISCDPWLIVCQCDGAFHCAWLSWACGEIGGVQGFDDECYIPGSVPGTDAVLRDVAKLAKEASVIASKERRVR